jgi:ligand-binding sensor domain-containing protein
LKKIAHIVLVIALCLPASLAAQYENSRFKKFTIASGLSDNAVSSIAQDEKGFIWIGTHNGLNRFDARIFDKFYSSADTATISGSRINQLKTFSNGNLGVMTNKGFAVLNTQTLKIKRYEVPDTTRLSFSSNYIFDAVELPGNRFAFTGATGFYVCGSSGNFITRYEHFSLKDLEENKRRIFFGNNIFAVSEKDYLLYYHDMQLGYYDYRQNKFSLTSPSITEKWKNFSVSQNLWTIKKQINRDEYLFLSFINDSLVYYNHKTGLRKATRLPITAIKSFFWDSYINFVNDSNFTVNCAGKGFYLFTLNRSTGSVTMSPALLLPEYKCTVLFTDREGRLWVGTSEGLLMYKKELPQINAISTDLPSDSKKSETENTCIYKYSGKLFVGRFSDNNGIVVYDDRTKKVIRSINFFNGNNKYNGVLTIQCYYPDTLWVSTEKGILWLNVNNYSYGRVDPNDVYRLTLMRLGSPAPDGKAWLLRHFTNTVIRYDINKREFEDAGLTPPYLNLVKGIKHIVQDSYGNTWFAGNGLCRWNAALQKIDTVIGRMAGRYPLETRVSCIAADRHGSLWLAVIDNGLLELRIKENKWVVHTSNPLIPESQLGTFSPVVNDLLWFSNGISFVSLNVVTRETSVYGEAAGVPAKNNVSHGKHYFYDTVENKLYLSILDYFAELPLPPESEIPKTSIIIKQLLINNQTKINFPADTIALSYQQNQLTITPGIIDFEQGTWYRYEYKFNNQPEWNPLGENPAIILNNLNAGKHQIAIRVSGVNKPVHEKKITIIISPPIWKTTGFYIFSALFTAGCLYLLYKRRVKNIRSKASVNYRLAEFEMKALHAQMNPHFIFNCLNSIKGLIVNNQNHEASQYLNRFSVLVRKNLDHSRSQFISLKENIDYLIQYMEIENYRFGNIKYSVTAEEEIDTEETLIAPMLLQPLVENAIWHAPQHSLIEIRISFTQHNNIITCIIDDNGLGILHKQKQAPAGGRHSVGLKNIQERISLLNQKFGLGYELNIRDKSEVGPGNNGTMAVLHFKSK